MDVKTSRELKLRDLPRIESPFFAVSRVESQLGSDTFFEAKIRNLLNPFSGSGIGCRGGIDRDKLRRCLERGEFFLVYGISDGKPFSPLVVWETTADASDGGHWRFIQWDPIGLSHLKSQVARLNEWAITPEAIEISGPGAVGQLTVSGFDMDLRERRADERYLAQQEARSQLSTPIGEMASVAPIPVSAATGNEDQSSQAKADTPKAIYLEVGLFTDGTLNNAGNVEIYRQQVEEECLAPRRNGEIDDAECERRLALLLGASYANAESNIAKLRDLYVERELESRDVTTRSFRVYVPGPGSKTGGSDSLAGMATGLGETGVIAQVKKAFSELAKLAADAAGGAAIDCLTLDLFGFSRGAAAARHAAFEIGRGSNGELGRSLAGYGIRWPSEVNIRFVGLFDTVAGIVNIAEGDFAAGNARNAPVNLYLDPVKVQTAVHLTALDERRANFALNSLQNPDGSLPTNFREIELPGAHSDIGGGYQDSQTEDLLLSPVLTLDDSRTEWPEQTLEWDNLATLKQVAESEGWIGDYSLNLPPGEPPIVEIQKAVDKHPTPYGRVDLSLRMKREVRGDYSRISLKLMHSLAETAGVPINAISTATFDDDLPKDLDPIYKKWFEEVSQGNDALEISAGDRALIKQRYTHRSDHYNLAEFLAWDTFIAIEVPFDSLSPFRPAKDRKRIIHFNMRGAEA
ncbi:T6SS phospholipase effector Tle1-like catalytic domain-containing protein [Marinobacter fonticola]|uniref:T6SS phospholipase effector Tle1-like catalytic domain-containing protein n=1 Tax=Marinobacter fonticola TaxID=2603215 RepID=UPI00143CD650|nr:DUF2235 domain-containing protein [Marinobacter fonticola]